jgi:hypothetical protein
MLQQHTVKLQQARQQPTEGDSDQSSSVTAFAGIQPQQQQAFVPSTLFDFGCA